MTRTGDLLLLQELDGRLFHDGARLAAVEAAIEGDPELERLRREGLRAARRRATAETEMSDQEVVVDGLRKRAGDLERHLYSGTVGNPQELMGMQRDLDGLRARIGEQEERLLEAMEAAETAAATEREATGAVDERTRGRAADAGALIEEAATRRTELSELQHERDDLAASLAGPDLARYERLSGRVRPVVVRLSGDSCGGCHMPLGNSEVRRVRTGDSVVQCSTCDRIVVS